MKTDTKVYDYKKDKVRQAILGAFKKNRGESTVADLVAFTGLPKYQVETELPAVADEYSGRLKVTESGEILYSFPRGYASRYRGFIPGLKRFWKGFKKGLAAVLSLLFKIWIMVMLIGYFALFVALVVVALVASIAGTFAGGKDSKSSGRSGGIGGLGLAMRLVELFVRIWFYNEMFNGSSSSRGSFNLRARSKEQRRPLHKAIFSFVFGEPDPNAEHDAVQKQVFVSLARQKKGIVLLEDFMSLTGLPPADAELAISSYLYEFEGSAEVSPSGTVYYHFPSLLKSARAVSPNAVSGDSGYSAMKKLRQFSANKGGSNFWYGAINTVNLAFGSYFIYMFASGASTIVRMFHDKMIITGSFLYEITGSILSQFLGVANPAPVLLVSLGIVPVAFSALFWLVPALRFIRLKKQNELVKRENARRYLYSAALAHPARVDSGVFKALPASSLPTDQKKLVRAVDELAAYEAGEPDSAGAWNLAELQRKVRDADALRAKVRPEDYEAGATVFDSDS